MMPRDIPLFAAFVLSPASELYTRWQFDVHVGQGYCQEPCFNPWDRAQALELTRLRIDAVGWDQQWPTLFEVKPDARLSAIGQLVGYRHHFRKEKRTEPRLAIITDTTTPDIEEIAAAEGITIYLVEPVDLSGVRRACLKVAVNCDGIIRIPEIVESEL
jgi:hypothetical protein